ncbi:MAG TPA: cytochrome c peroxidase [Polyangiaceae bacterium]|nr:cytochrome c peroxidase [Polyangiaceae bacterium]
MPLRRGPAQDERLVALGSRLFHDPLLSGDGTVSCASCHDLAQGGDDGRARSRGAGGKEGVINAPTVLNAALNPSQFWDGRARTLEDQIDGPIQHPLEMAGDWASVERKLGANAQYTALFQAAFAAAPSRQGVKQAIASFERTLITLDAPFDLWLDGDASALSAAQREGYELFKSAGCVACHQGQNAGGNMYQSFGVFGNYFEDRGNITEVDYGRYNVTKVEEDRFVFRVPSLRNVELTAPYFHDGSAKTLPDAVKVMIKYQLGKELAEDQVGKLVEFLKSLTGRQKSILASREAGSPT